MTEVQTKYSIAMRYVLNRLAECGDDEIDTLCFLLRLIKVRGRILATDGVDEIDTLCFLLRLIKVRGRILATDGVDSLPQNAAAEEHETARKAYVRRNWTAKEEAVVEQSLIDNDSLYHRINAGQIAELAKVLGRRASPCAAKAHEIKNRMFKERCDAAACKGKETEDDAQ